MVKRNILLWCFILTFLVISVSPSVFAQYGAGDTVYVRYPESGMGVAVAEMPKFVRYTLKNPSGTLVYEEDHTLTYKNQLFYGFAWEWYDEYYVRVPGFPETGTWTIEGRLFSEFLWVIEDPNLFTYEYQFQVQEDSLLDNLLAPSYFTMDMGFIFGRVSFALPFHWSLLFAVLAVVIVAIFFMLRMVRRSNVKKK